MTGEAIAILKNIQNAIAFSYSGQNWRSFLLTKLETAQTHKPKQKRSHHSSFKSMRSKQKNEHGGI
ncbi:MAG TPA: hypothetical protein V6D28_00475 [Leptolyngbyaceae cyanobacterium]